MTERKLQSKIKTEITRYFFMCVACFSYALALDIFIVPNSIVSGGVTGLSTLISILSGAGVGIISIALNIPLLLAGLKTQGLAFILRCFITITILGIFIDLLAPIVPVITTNPIIAAVYGGIFQGIAIGLFYRYSVSSGGTELLARMLLRLRPFHALSVGTTLAIIDGIIVLVGSTILKNPENVLFALIVIFIAAKVSDFFITGIDYAKLCYIITDRAEEISKVLIENSPRGITKLNGMGMYTKNPRDILMTVVKKTQIIELRKLVNDVDPEAFIIVTEASEVLGKGFKEIQPYKK